MDEASKVSAFTFPVAALGAFAIWLLFFTLIYDAYVSSFGSTSYYDYIAQASILDSIAYTWSIIRVRNTVGLSIWPLSSRRRFYFSFCACGCSKAAGRCRARSSTSCISGRCLP
ncbi:hypothetical protein AJ87_12905 [Rhizobium yanglingense]|nr:hypothetical protein AJ87_12905 [Rhizobium yanglingense]